MDTSLRPLVDVVHVDVAPPRAARHPAAIAIAQAHSACHRARQRSTPSLDATLGAQIAHLCAAAECSGRAVAELDGTRARLQFGSRARRAMPTAGGLDRRLPPRRGRLRLGGHSLQSSRLVPRSMPEMRTAARACRIPRPSCRRVRCQKTDGNLPPRHQLGCAARCRHHCTVADTRNDPARFYLGGRANRPRRILEFTEGKDHRHDANCHADHHSAALHLLPPSQFLAFLPHA